MDILSIPTRMKQIFSILGWLLSPTHKIIDLQTNKGTPEQRGGKLRNWNKGFFWFELFLVIVLMIVSKKTSPQECLLATWLSIIYAWSRCNEIVYAFYSDSFSSLNKEDKKSDLKSVDRIRMAMKSYVGLTINFALLYFFIPFGDLFDEQFVNFFDSLYFSGVTITTLGYGDINPTHFLSRLLVLYEVFAGILLIVIAISTYVSSIAED